MTNGENHILYEFGEFHFDTKQRRLKSKNGGYLHLPPKAIDILHVLIEANGEIVEKNDLMETVWADTIVEESNLTQTIYLLRKALGENADGRLYIQNLPKRGYRFAGDVREIGKNPTQQKQFDKIVVLPFENLSGEDEIEYLAEGLSENLIDSLSQIPQIGVISRSSAFKYKTSGDSPGDFANSLGVRFIVEGRIMQRGEKTLIRAELVDLENEIQLWGKTIECRICDLQKIQTEILENVVEKLGFDLTEAQTNRLVKHATLNDEAYQMYLSGLFLYRKGSVENAVKALEFYDKATELDPEFAIAYALKPAIYAFLTEGYMDKKKAYDKAAEAAAKALKFGEDLPQSHVAAAIIKKWELDFKGAEREYLRTFELNPNNSSAHNNYALILSSLGRDEEALKEIEIAAQLDPLMPYVFEVNKAWILTNDGRFDEALSLLLKVAEQFPDLKMINAFVGAAYEGKGEFKKAIAVNRQVLDEKPLSSYAKADIIYNLFKIGENTKARKMFKSLLNEEDYISPLKLAAIREIEGSRGEALKTLEDGYKNRDSELHSLKTDVRLKSLHDEPRFQDLLRKVGLI